MTIRIRAAEQADIDAMMPVLHSFFAEARLVRWFAYDPEHVRLALLAMFGRPDVTFLLAEREGEIIGAAGLLVSAQWHDPTTLVATELFWFIRPEWRGSAGPRLLRALEDAARAGGATVGVMIALEELSPDRVGALYRRRGYEPAEHVYMRRI